MEPTLASAVQEIVSEDSERLSSVRDFDAAMSHGSQESSARTLSQESEASVSVGRLTNESHNSERIRIRSLSS